MSWDSWDGPDRKSGPPVTDKPLCSTRPAPDLEGYVAMSTYLAGRGLDAATALANRWYPSRTAGDGFLRMVIPATSSDLTNRYWQARIMDDACITDGPPRVLRYESPHGVRRGDAVVLVYPRIGPHRGTGLVEGPTDALALAEVGWVGIAFMGKTPGPEPILFAQRLLVPNRPVVVIADKDAVASATAIWEFFPGSFLVNTYPHKDIGAMKPDERKDLLRGNL